MTTHELKCWHEPFQAILDDLKTYEIRKDDRRFRVGDVLRLREYVPGATMYPGFDNPQRTALYTGRSLLVEVTYLSKGGTWGLPADLCVMSIRKVESTSERGGQ